MAELLLKHNADIEARDDEDRTPLHDAALCNSIEVMKQLLEHNANIKARDKANQTPLDIARSSWRNNETVKSLLMQHAVNTF